MPKQDYDYLQILRLQMATEMLRTRAVGKYLAFPSEIERIADAIDNAYMVIAAVESVEGIRQCKPPFCDDGSQCVPCGRDRVRGPAGQVAKKGGRTGNGKPRRPSQHTGGGSQPRRRV
jgi:hypothetical protein